MTMPDNRDKDCILIVDDTPENIDVLSGVLRPHYKVKAAVSGEKALKISGGEKPPNLILLDVMMPEMDGYEVCRRIKEDEATKEIPVIFVTGMSDAAEIEKGFALGAVDYMTKPIDPTRVLETVAKHLKRD